MLIKRIDLEAMITPRQTDRHVETIERVRQRLSRPLTEEEKQAAMAAFAAGDRLNSEMLEKRGGQLFSDSVEIIREMREERSNAL